MAYSFTLLFLIVAEWAKHSTAIGQAYIELGEELTRDIGMQ